MIRLYIYSVPTAATGSGSISNSSSGRGKLFIAQVTSLRSGFGAGK